MEKYIYKIRSDRLAVFNVQKIDEQIRSAAKLLSMYAPEEILVASRKKNGYRPVKVFAEAIGGAIGMYGRFMPGTLTNPNDKHYLEPKVVLITDPFSDRQVIEEAFKSNIPIIGFCDTFNDPKYMDLIIPMNNKGRKAIALVYWILAREVLKKRKELKGDAEFKYSVEDFEIAAEEAKS